MGVNSESMQLIDLVDVTYESPLMWLDLLSLEYKRESVQCGGTLHFKWQVAFSG